MASNLAMISSRYWIKIGFGQSSLKFTSAAPEITNTFMVLNLGNNH